MSTHDVSRSSRQQAPKCLMHCKYGQQSIPYQSNLHVGSWSTLHRYKVHSLSKVSDCTAFPGYGNCLFVFFKCNYVCGISAGRKKCILVIHLEEVVRSQMERWLFTIKNWASVLLQLIPLDIQLAPVMLSTVLVGLYVSSWNWTIQWESRRLGFLD